MVIGGIVSNLDFASEVCKFDFLTQKLAVQMGVRIIGMNPHLIFYLLESEDPYWGKRYQVQCEEDTVWIKQTQKI